MFLGQVLVIIDVKPKDLGLPTEAYISVEEVHDVSHLAMNLGGSTSRLLGDGVFFFFFLFSIFRSTNLLSL